jgi:hypothetical protein
MRWLFLLIVCVLAFVVGCNKSPEKEPAPAPQQQPFDSSERATIPLRYTVLDSVVARSCRDRDSALETVKMTFEQLKSWEKASPPEDRTILDQVYGQGNYQKLIKQGYVEIIWRESSNHQVYTVRNDVGSRTSRDEKSVLDTVGMSEEQVRAWVADEEALSEGRRATFARRGYNEGLSWGKLEIPPFEW